MNQMNSALQQTFELLEGRMKEAIDAMCPPKGVSRNERQCMLLREQLLVATAAAVMALVTEAMNREPASRTTEQPQQGRKDLNELVDEAIEKERTQGRKEREPHSYVKAKRGSELCICGLHRLDFIHEPPHSSSQAQGDWDDSQGRRDAQIP